MSRPTALSLEASLSVTPPRASVAWERDLQRAERQIERKQFQQAHATLERALYRGGNDVSCALQVADLYGTLGAWQEALAAAEQAVALAPAYLSTHEMVMYLALEMGDDDRARQAGEALVAIEPRHFSAHNTLGAVYMRQGNIKAALRTANILIRLDPNNSAHYFHRAIIHQHQGHVEKAITGFTTVILLAPDGPFTEAARDALEILDSFQIGQIFQLASEDRVFRFQLEKDAPWAIAEKGFYLSSTGHYIFKEMLPEALAELPMPCFTALYH